MINWRRLFGLALKDFFDGLYYEVELEKNLTIQEQYLDIVIIRKSVGNPPKTLPDGLENLSYHNLLTYKSLREPLDKWTLDELVGYYTIYRKQVSPDPKKLLPVEQFKLYAVCTRKPQWLNHYKAKKQIKDGVYEVETFTGSIRIIITSQIAQSDANAILQLFSGKAEGFRFGETHYQWRRPRSRGLLKQLFEMYFKEDIVMSYTWEDFERDYAREHLHLLSPKDVVEQFSPKEVLGQFSPKEVLGQFSPEAIEKYLAKLKKP